MIEHSEASLKFATRLEKQLRLKQAKQQSVDGITARSVPGSREADRSSGASADALKEVEALAVEIEECAAVSGRFDPHSMLPANVSEDVRVAALTRIACSSTVETSRGTKTWVLDGRRRLEALSRLIKENRLSSRLTSPLPPTDRFGEMLRQVLRDGAAVPIDALSREDLLAVAAAVEATPGDIAKPDVNRIRQLISRKQFLSDYDVLLEDGFVGREQELRKLDTFLTASAAGPRQWSGLVLTGLGGAGKSTLLAKFASDAVREKKATVVILDFDRPGIDPNDTPWLEMEMARQVALQYPAVEDMLREVREGITQYRRELNVQQSFDPDRMDVERGLRSVVSEIHNALGAVGAAERPFLVVLDTFEEVMQRDLGPKAIDWLDEIADNLWPTPLRVIFSGRLFDKAREVLKGSGISDDVEVAELEPHHAERLLRMLNVPDPWARQLANSDLLPRRPLELKLLARLVAEEGIQSLPGLEDALRRGGKPARDLFAGLVYRRVLLRIRNPTVRELAYPGLVLRFVTTPLVQKVLAPALDLAEMDEDEANRALESLGSYEWLAYRGDNGEVCHRKDLRRSMLRAMIAEDPDKAERISRSAAEYFATFPDDKNWAEGIYHRLMLIRSRAHGEGFEPEELKKANEYIGGDIADLPPEAAALLRLATGHDLAPSEVRLLPDRHLKAAYDATGMSCTNMREFGVAAALYNDVRGAGLLSPHTPLQSWEVDTLFATASWDTLRELDGPGRRPAQKRQYAIRDVVDLVFPQTIVSGPDVDASQVERVLAQAADSPLRRIDRPHRQALLSRLAVGLVLVNHDAPLSPSARQSLETLVARVRKEEGDTSNALFERRILLLDLIRRPSDPSAITVPISPLTVTLNPRALHQLATLAERFDDRGRKYVSDLVAAVDEVFKHGKRGRFTARTMLGSINGLTTTSPNLRVDARVPFGSLNNIDDWEILRGPDPEFRDPCRFALLEAFADRSAHLALGELFASTIPHTLEDLAPDPFASAMGADPEHALESYVELADRAGVLLEILRRAGERRPSPKLTQVTNAYERWIDAIRTTFLRTSS